MTLPPTIALLAQSAAPARTQTNLSGTWRLVEMSIDRFNTQAVGMIETERPIPETFLEESRTIEIDGDIVTVHGKGRKGFLPPITNEQYRLDGQPHTFQYGDIPGQTAVRTGRWLSDVDGFELIDKCVGSMGALYRSSTS